MISGREIKLTLPDITLSHAKKVNEISTKTIWHEGNTCKKIPDTCRVERRGSWNCVSRRNVWNLKNTEPL